jgi:NAD-dependent SIR2 family protein deacetylase
MSEKEGYSVFIEHIIKQLSEGKMSAMVGAGFSKNANKNYPTWTELLFDMVQEIYKVKTKKKKKALIDEKGYSSIIEKYINFKGHRESVDFYIEKQFLKISNNNDLEAHEKLLNLPWNNVYTTNYDDLLETAYNNSYKMRFEYTKITDSVDLAVKPSKRIIKLHGSLRDPDEEKNKVFCFDNCREHNYIITKKDYDTYPQRHEAFTQLMRISLLQEKFCLFGFSATDPNFLSWVNWVKDILERKWIKSGRNHKTPQDYNIFLFDVSNENIEKSKEQHFFNLGIKVILLKKIFPNLSEKRTIIELLDSFSSGIDENNNFFNKMWANLFNIATNWSEDKKKEFFDNFYKIQEQQCVFRITSKLISEYFAPHIRSRALNYLGKNDLDINEKLNLYDFLATTINTSREINVFYYEEIKKYPIEFLKIKPEELSRENKLKWLRFVIVLMKSYRLAVDKKAFDIAKGIVYKNFSAEEPLLNEVVYQECLFYAMLFQFKDLEKKLKEWKLDENSESQWLLKKAFLYRITNSKKDASVCINLVRKKLKSIKMDQERLLCLEIIGYHDKSENFRYDDYIQYGIDVLRSKGYIALDSTIKSTIKPILEKQTSNKVMPFGKKDPLAKPKEHPEKFSDAIKLSELLLEVGCPACLDSVVMINEADWFEVHKTFCKNNAPLQVAFHSFQYGGNDMEEKTISRFAQDIAFSESIDSKIKEIITENLWQSFNYLLITKDEYRRKYLFALAEFAKVVPYKVWGAEFKKFWRYQMKKLSTHNFFFKEHWGITKPVQIFLSFLDDKKLVKELTETILTDFPKLSKKEKKYAEVLEGYLGDKDYLEDHSYKSVVSAYIYSLQNNKHFGVVDENGRLFVKEILGSEKIGFYEFAKAYYVISGLKIEDKNIQRMVNKAIEKYLNENELQGWQYKLFVALAKNNPKVNKIIKNKILSSDFYCTGISGSTITYSRGQIIQISELMKTDGFAHGLVFTKKEERLVSLKIAKNIDEINKFNSKNSTKDLSRLPFAPLYDQYNICLEMRAFLSKSKHLSKNKNLELSEKIDKLILNSSKMKTYKEGLFSTDREKYNVFLNKVIIDYNGGNYSLLKELWDSMISNLMAQTTPKLENTIEFVSEVIEKEPFNGLFDENRIQNYIALLEKHHDCFPEDSDFLRIYRSIHKIIKALKKHNVEDHILDNWLKKLKSSQFVEVKELVEAEEGLK